MLTFTLKKTLNNKYSIINSKQLIIKNNKLLYAMPYFLKNNKIDERYETKFFAIIKENLNNEKIDEFNFLLKKKTAIIRDFLNNIGKRSYSVLDYENILSMIFSIRRHKEKILSTVDIENLNSSFKFLAQVKKLPEVRLARFLETFGYDDLLIKKDISLEILHFFEPDKNALWTSWIYRQDNGTGSLPYMADFLKRTWDGNPYVMPFSLKDMSEETGYLYELSAKNGFYAEPPYGADILLAYMYSDYVFKMVYAESKSLSPAVPDGYSLMKKLLGVEKLRRVSC